MVQYKTLTTGTKVGRRGKKLNRDKIPREAKSSSGPKKALRRHTTPEDNASQKMFSDGKQRSGPSGALESRLQ